MIFTNKDTKSFKTEDVDVNKIKVSMKKFYSQKTKSYKHYIGYNDNDEVIALQCLSDVMIKNC